MPHGNLEGSDVAVVTDAMRRLPDEPGLRLPTDSPGGAGALVAAFNTLAERLEEWRETREAQRKLQRDLDALKSTLLSVANGTFSSRAPRDNSGDAMDVLAFLVNSTADEVQELIGALHREHEKLELAQAQLVETEKLAALGRLAAGVAHELNQPLTVIVSLLSMLQGTRPVTAEKQEELFSLMNNAATHITQIVDSVRTFGRPSPFKTGRLSPLEPLRRAERLVAADLRALGAVVKEDFEERLPEIRANGDRLQQVFVNLLCNARDALEGTPGTERQVRLRVHAKEGHVVYQVEDNGAGVTEDQRALLFEPFFTTKASKGTGLGLSVSLNIVREHGGFLEHQPGASGGSVFIVRIPQDDCAS